MNQHHLSYFKVENFKCFESIELKQLKQFNLILGDNSTGKTSLLEALMFDIEAEIFAKNLLSVLYKFRRFNRLKETFWRYYTNSNVEKMPFFEWQNGQAEDDPYKYSLQIRTRNEDWEQKYDYSCRDDHQKAIFGLKDGRGTKKFPNELDISFYKAPFVSPTYLYAHELTDTYTRFIQTNKTSKYHLLTALRHIMPDLIDIELAILQTDTPVIIVWRENLDYSIPLAACGDAFVKVFRIVSEIIANRNKRLMIDDIDTNIHYLRLPQFWKTVFLIADNYEVQLFFTTNNWVALQAFKMVLKEDEMKDFVEKVRIFKLEMTENQILNQSLSFEEFVTIQENENDEKPENDQNQTTENENLSEK